MQKESAPQINLDYLQQIMENTAAFGYIDPLENLKYARLWFYSAQNDTVVDPLVVQKNMDLYSRFTEEKQILSIFTNPGEHSQPTLTYGNPCDFLGTPFINNCAFDAAGSQLQHLYGPLNPPTKNTSGILFEFDQSTYIPLLPPLPPFTETGLAKTAYMYIPQQCTTTKSDPCALHITFHGCEQTTQDIGLSYIKHAGYIEWADTNGIVILFPQATATLTNPKGCFDWWGYTGADYASNLGIQIQTVYAMIKAIII
jgi:hypothetical protein